MAVLSLLTAALAASYSHSALAQHHHVRSAHHTHDPTIHRRQSIPTVLPGNWTSRGCFTEGNGGRALTGAATASDTMTIESCIAFCDARNFIFSGVEFGQECFCDNNFRNGAVQTALAECNMPCKGNAAEVCGAGGRLNVFWSGKTPPPPPSTVPRVGNWLSIGCVTDGVNGAPRTLPVGKTLPAPTTIEGCTSACFDSGFPLAGTEFGAECFCGTSLSNGATSPLTDCNMVCAGNGTQFCGGPNRLNVYNYTGTDLPTTGGGGGGGPPAGGVKPVTSGLPTPWKYAACYVDNANGRVFETTIPVSQTNTVQSCVATCRAQNFTLAGTEFANECYCGNRLVNGAVVAPEADCNMGCAGNSTQACGGPGRLSVYTATTNVTALPVPVAKTTGLPGKWTYAGCFTDTNTRVLPWQNIFSTNSVESCTTRCSDFGFTAAGMEFGTECYCGDTTDLTAANGATKVAENQCNVQCPGDPLSLCGGGLRLTTYTWNGTVNVWHTPANTGRYEFLVGGLVTPLIATVGINNKVTFLEKAGTGLPNTTGAYELDLTLTNNISRAWREMHLKTDVFCAGSVILPDKGGRQLNVGGWSGDSTFGVRFYTPSGSDGVNGTTDWEEDHHQIALQRGRWYPTTNILANGSILVIGGEIGSNDVAQPNLEILPRTPGGNTVIELEWLARTDPWNLYPFVVVLPSGRIFVAYYNEARILNPTTFATFKVLPNIPGAVNNFLAGRTYPLEGAMTVFPQSAPYTALMRILICGGSTPGPAIVVDNCVSIEPEAANPVWQLERMPSRRVMPCMTPLPDGTFLIANGAKEGVAGFGLAGDPNLQALLYDPVQPVGQRISILNSTIVPRMYHSEAILLPDARVMISGSDPQTPGFDEEMRVEVYVPPYLTAGRRQPTFTITNKDWAYGASVTFNVQLFQGATSALRVSLLAAASSTHGNLMGARTIFPAVSCNGNTCTVTAPPNSSISPPGWHMMFILDGPTPSKSVWVRIGGDPAGLGSWPNIPGFTRPGS